METNRISHAPAGWLITVIFSAATLFAQETPPDSSEQVPYSEDDSTRTMPPPLPGDTIFFAPDTTYPDTTTPYTAPDTVEMAISPGDTTQASLYNQRTYVAKGPADEIRHIPFFLTQNPGPVGSPAIPVPYLNVAGVDVTVNGMPFLYQGLYRPYSPGTDLNTIPWEILNDIILTPHAAVPVGFDFRVGRPPGLDNRSDIEIARGPYGYSSSRWRFFRPFGARTYAYFTIGFKKSDGFIENSDYDGYHVTGGLARKIGPGQFSLDIWRHRAKTGLNSFNFVVPQVMRQSRNIDRGEARYEMPLGKPLYLGLTGLYQRSAQTISGYIAPVKTKLDIAGGKAVISDSLPGITLSSGLEYYRLKLYGLPGAIPSTGIFSGSAGLDGQGGRIAYLFGLVYAWNGIDHGVFLPTARMSYEISPVIKPYVAAARTRSYPDLYLRYFSDSIPGLGVQGYLASYAFKPDPDISTPVTSLASIGVDSDFGPIRTGLGVSYKRIDSQIQVNYKADSAANFTVSPANFDDRFIEFYGLADAAFGPLAAEIAGVFRRWDDRYFADNLEKGPVAMGYSRLSYRKQFFIPRLYLGASIEARLSSRRDYRSFETGFTDAFAAVFGRFEFQYKDLTFWVAEDNITNATYITWWPYYEAPRSIWWGLRWRFFD